MCVGGGQERRMERERLRGGGGGVGGSATAFGERSGHIQTFPKAD